MQNNKKSRFWALNGSKCVSSFTPVLSIVHSICYLPAVLLHLVLPTFCVCLGATLTSRGLWRLVSGCWWVGSVVLCDGGCCCALYLTTCVALSYQVHFMFCLLGTINKQNGAQQVTKFRKTPRHAPAPLTHPLTRNRPPTHVRGLGTPKSIRICFVAAF